jgi:phosphatidylglycerophosphatase A
MHGPRPGHVKHAVRRFLILFLASAGYLSYIPHRVVAFEKWKGGGLIGSLAGLALLLAFPPDARVLWPATVLLTALSVWVGHRAEQILAVHDDPRIVIDEVVGMWWAALFLPREVAPLVLALILFRVFDVWKGPWGRRAQHLPGGWGVVCDDLIAGLLANLLTRLVGRLAPFF